MEAVPWWSVVRRRWTLVLALTVLGAVASLAWVSQQAPTYTASTTLFFSPSSGSTASELNQGTAYTQNLVRSFAQVANAEQVLGPVVRQLDLDTTPARLARSVTAQTAPDSLLLTITVVGAEPRLVARTADAVAEELTNVVAELSPVSRTTERTIKVTTVAEAQVPEGPTNRRLLVLLAGPLLGLLLGVGVAGLRELLDDRVRTARQVRDVTGLDLLGTVEGPAGDGPGTVQAPSEAVRRLRTNLLAALQREGATSVLLTSPAGSEASASVAADLAGSLVERGLRVLLVDADLRTAAVGRRLGLPAAPGLSEVIAGSLPVQSALRQWQGTGLVLTAGSAAEDAGALLASPRLTALLDQVEKAFDVVLVHSAPVLPDADAGILSSQVHATLVVADSAATTRAQLRQALAALELANAAVLGVVLTASGGADELSDRRRTSRPPSDGVPPVPAPDRTPRPAGPAEEPARVAGAVRNG
jgi:capsular exopolysaccharide synthesis family protein